jgi:uncharacterized protein
LDARHHPAADPAAPTALVLHPNPQFGGNMNTLVVYTLFTVFQDAGFGALRFNFRGTGKSAGQFTSGAGELADALAAWDWLAQSQPTARKRYVAGFSFGAWIGLQLAQQRLVDGLILVAPPVNRLDFSFVNGWPAPTLLIHGTADALVPESAVSEFADQQNAAGNITAGYHAVAGASHFFESGQEELARLASGWLQTTGGGVMK